MIPLRYPDKPARSTAAVLDRLDEHVALSKLDGWRCLTVVDENEEVLFLSRSLRLLPVCDAVRNTVKELVVRGKLRAGTVLDGEWLRRRPGYEGHECLYLFSPLVLMNEWVGHRPFIQRWAWLHAVLRLPEDRLSDALPQHDLLVPAWATHDLAAFYERHVGVTRTEGVVVYKKDGQHHGSTERSLKVRDMLKVKWREGEGERA
jgi:hypothetical protein